MSCHRPDTCAQVGVGMGRRVEEVGMGRTVEETVAVEVVMVVVIISVSGFVLFFACFEPPNTIGRGCVTDNRFLLKKSSADGIWSL